MKKYQTVIERIAHKTLRFFDRTFSQRIEDGPPTIAQMVENSSAMIVSSHRSHVDYFLLGEVFFRRGLKSIRFAAGDNLTELPYIGKKFLSFGAFPVERNRTSGKNYMRRLCEQVVSMAADNESIIVFPESGRSYSGAMLQMRGVVLSAQIIAQWRYPDRNFFIIPVAISYEHLPELRSFKMLKKGKELRKNQGNLLARLYGNILYFGADILAFIRFLNAHRFGKNYSRVYVDYGAPYSIKQAIDLKTNFNKDARDEFSAHRLSIQELTTRIHHEITALYRILPMHVLATIIHTRHSLTIETAISKVPEIRKILLKEHRNTKSINELSDEQLIDEAIRTLSRMRGVKRTGSKIQVIDKSIIKYYAATIDHPRGHHA